MEQKRFLAAIILSAAILFVWQYFFSPPPPQPEQPAAVATTNETIAPPPAASTQPQTPSSESLEATPQPDAVPQRTIVVETPLYRVAIDSRGAVPTSWVIKNNKDNGKDLYSVGADVSERMSLELIAQSPLGKTPREAPLRFVSDQSELEAILNNRSYVVTDSTDDKITLAQGEQRRLSFAMRDEASGTLATKSFVFNGENYEVALDAKVERSVGTQPLVELSVGPSIGDQGVPQYTFYSVAPEAVFGYEGGRRTASAISEDEATPGKFVINDRVDWVGIGDTYFAMVVVPTQKFERARFSAEKYEHEHAGAKEDRHLISGFVPVPGEGLRAVVYTGPKDNDLLTAASINISSAVNRPVNLDELIDYGYLSGVFRRLAIPIASSLKAINRVTHNYGLAIIIFTFVVYSLFFPLKWRSSKAMKKAQKMAPRMKEVQEKMKTLKPDDPRLRELQMEQFRLMKEGNILGGCLPMLIQMPFFIALYKAITISLDFRQATFLWLPDLSAADPWHLLPVLMAASILVVQLITPAPNADPVQRKMMAIMVPVVMLYAMWSAPAGLLVYWLFGNIITFLQQMFINKLLSSSDKAVTPDGDAMNPAPAA